MGPLMLDLAAGRISAEEKELLAHPLTGGVILFSRNFESLAQLQQLIREIRAAAGKPLLIAVDHEGGRVQRFREGFSAIPAMGALIEKAGGDNNIAGNWAEQFGWLMASEVLALDIDISFAPVLDVRGISEVIGDRSFASQPEQVTLLAGRFMQGMHNAGMKTTGKHFPGHGSVLEDSHIAMPVDKRAESEIRSLDMQVFVNLQQQGVLDAVMPAHVIYSEVDKLPACFSRRWLQHILREELKFDGAIFSDDLSMQGAVIVGDFEDRASAALGAGCDMLLVCNDRAGAIQVLDRLDTNYPHNPRLSAMAKSSTSDLQQLQQSPQWQRAQQALKAFYAD
ncbi:beta-N-acetylhexosaminidase [Lacimicrobium alkaliphilum]|uniref:Beta-hexosaminidase n=1 Tax=Lacimicrobium alkaliphilum TaxID=1526571 RepID=A0A0U3BAZ6_9ALTE|nr:beta-N-acetylhexosaminidase [Lacimicrobium alkaliphilum]ALS98821.1 beta-hexosaminidase [Lacimicrobium alkaliphilum]